MNKRPFTSADAETKPGYPTRSELAELVKMGAVVAVGGVMSACEQSDKRGGPTGREKGLEAEIVELDTRQQLPGIVFEPEPPPRPDADAEPIEMNGNWRTVIITSVIATDGVPLLPVSPSSPEEIELSTEELAPELIEEPTADCPEVNPES